MDCQQSNALKPLFLSTLSLRRATGVAAGRHRNIGISIHALLAESDMLYDTTALMKCISIHALLAESDTMRTWQKVDPNPFLSTLSLRRATQAQSLKVAPLSISIHALLAESDRPGLFFQYIFQNFYPRSPCGERPPRSRNNPMGRDISIHALLAESDLGNAGVGLHMSNFYPRSPCGERHCLSRILT